MSYTINEINNHNSILGLVRFCVLATAAKSWLKLKQEGFYGVK